LTPALVIISEQLAPLPFYEYLLILATHRNLEFTASSLHEHPSFACLPLALISEGLDTLADEGWIQPPDEENLTYCVNDCLSDVQLPPPYLADLQRDNRAGPSGITKIQLALILLAKRGKQSEDGYESDSLCGEDVRLQRWLQTDWGTANDKAFWGEGVDDEVCPLGIDDEGYVAPPPDGSWNRAGRSGQGVDSVWDTDDKDWGDDDESGSEDVGGPERGRDGEKEGVDEDEEWDDSDASKDELERWSR
jgi:hypothetical protein